jgi:hypothetical protein
VGAIFGQIVPGYIPKHFLSVNAFFTRAVCSDWTDIMVFGLCSLILRVGHQVGQEGHNTLLSSGKNRTDTIARCVEGHYYLPEHWAILVVPH